MKPILVREKQQRTTTEQKIEKVNKYEELIVNYLILATGLGVIIYIAYKIFTG